VVVTAVALSACSRNDPATIDLGSPTVSLSGTDGGAVAGWLAVFRTDPDPNALNDDTATVKAIVDGAIVVSPAVCFDGLPSSIDPGAYVLGVVAPTKGEVDALVAKVGRSAIFEGQVRTMCVD
jgi:hypothetical protein